MVAIDLNFLTTSSEIFADNKARNRKEIVLEKLENEFLCNLFIRFKVERENPFIFSYIDGQAFLPMIKTFL